jgi:hypothetical protein
MTFSVLFLMLFFPLFFHGYHFGWPWVKGGDEPHYLIMINSLMNDGDFDLRNNYESALKGSDQAGRKYAGMPIGRHVEWKGLKIGWPQVVENPDKWPLDSQGHPVPSVKSGFNGDYLNLPEYPSHPAGMAVLLAPFLWFVRGTRLVEPLALFYSFLAVAMGAFLFHRLVRRYDSDPVVANAAVLLAFLASPIWMNARTLFTEPFLLFFALASYLLVVEKKSGFWPGLLLGLGGLLKPNFLILLLPPALFLLREHRWKALSLLFLGPSLSAVGTLYLNNLFMGSPFMTNNPVTFGNPLNETFYLLFSWNHGLFVFSPIAFYCLVVWKKYFAQCGSEAFLFSSGFALYFIFMACCWAGPWGWSFGPRHIIPVVPFIMVPMFYLWKDYQNFGKGPRMLIQAAIGISIFINFLGALDGYWDSNPLTIFAGNIAP